MISGLAIFSAPLSDFQPDTISMLFLSQKTFLKGPFSLFFLFSDLVCNQERKADKRAQRVSARSRTSLQTPTRMPRRAQRATTSIKRGHNKYRHPVLHTTTSAKRPRHPTRVLCVMRPPDTLARPIDTLLCRLKTHNYSAYTHTTTTHTSTRPQDTLLLPRQPLKHLPYSGRKAYSVRLYACLRAV